MGTFGNATRNTCLVEEGDELSQGFPLTTWTLPEIYALTEQIFGLTQLNPSLTLKNWVFTK